MNLAALNFKYQAGGRESTSSTGLLELRLGGAGTSLHLGTGGYRADLGTIAKTIGGRSDVLGVARAKLTGEGSHALGVLNTSNYLAIGGMRQLSQEIWGRKVAVAFEDLGEDYGYYHHSGDPNRIVINRRSNTNDREDVAVLAAGAAHEGQHRYDRTFHGRTNEYSAHRSGGAVYLNLMHGLGLKGNDRLMQSITAGLMSEQSKQTNTGPVDHWKLTADGGVAFTDEGWLQNEEGLYMNTDGTTSTEPIPGLTIGSEGIETGLLRILTGRNDEEYSGFGATEIDAAQHLMMDAGLACEVRGGADVPANRYWDGNPVIDPNDPNARPQTIGARMIYGSSFGEKGVRNVIEQANPLTRIHTLDKMNAWQRDAQRQSQPGSLGRAWSGIASRWNRLWGNAPEVPKELMDRPSAPHRNFEPGSPEWEENLEHFQEPLRDWEEALIAELDPSLQAQARAMINHGQYEGINVHPDKVYRSPEEQDLEYAKGRDAEGKKIGRTVTEARGGQSPHQYGLPIDIRIYDENGVSNWDFRTNPDWRRMVEIGESYGFYPGAYFPWDKPDFPHFEIPNLDYLDYLGR